MRFIFSILLLTLFCANNLKAQNELHLYLKSKDSTQIKNAKVLLNGLTLQYDTLRHYYYLNNCTFKKNDKLFFEISHKNYLTKKTLLYGSDFFHSQKNGANTYLRTIFLLNKSDHFLISGKDSIPFKYKPEILGIEIRQNDKENIKEIDNLMKKLNLEKVDDHSSSFIYLKKKNGGNFDNLKCKELKALRECEFIFAAGPIVNNGILGNTVYIEIDETNIEKVKESLKKSRIEFIKYNKSVEAYEFKADKSIGYSLIDSMNKLIFNNEVNNVQYKFYHKPNFP